LTAWDALSALEKLALIGIALLPFACMALVEPTLKFMGWLISKIGRRR